MATGDYTDTDKYPAYATKKAILQEFTRLYGLQVRGGYEFLARLNNADLTALADGDTVFDVADNFNAAVS